VVALVDGQAITRRDVVAELAAANVPKGMDAAALQPAAVSDLVNRQLMVQQAKQQGLDKDPDYLATVERARQLALAQMLATTWTAKQPSPNTQELSDFIAANPQMFSDHKVLILDQVATGSAGLVPTALVPLKSLDAIIDYLKAHGHPFQRQNASLDTLTAPPAAIRSIESLPPGEPFVTAQGATTFISVLKDTKAEPISGPQSSKIAALALQQRSNQRIIADHLKSLHAGAKIEFQPGFDPTPGKRP
jgi:EpsD family peptidyl-prolyl cis-trans isomerase